MDGAFDILVEERQKQMWRSIRLEKKDRARPRQWGGQRGKPYNTRAFRGARRSRAPNGSPTLALVPPQVSPKYVAEVVAELHRIRGELYGEKEGVERLKKGKTLARLDATAIAKGAQTNEERAVLVCAAAMIIRDEAHTWKDKHENVFQRRTTRNYVKIWQGPRATGRLHEKPAAHVPRLF